VLVPAELVRRAEAAGYTRIALTDHVDASTLEAAVRGAVTAAAALSRRRGIRVLPGVELTHNPPDQIPQLIREARRLGARVVVVHGETPVEPVPEGTNAMAIAGGCDVIAHPGFITLAEARRAARRGVALEITKRGGHSLTNGHVAAVGGRAGATLVVNTDTHAPGDLWKPGEPLRVARGAGLDERAARKVIADTARLAERLGAVA
jgi:histidinol phosphatase-like PHP family hydrolase